MHFLRTIKILALILFLSIASYTGLWFYVAHKIKQSVSLYADQQSNSWQISYDKLKITGFPFKLKAKFYDFKTQYNQPGISAAISYNTLKIESNLAFDTFKISPSKQVNYDLIHEGKESKLQDLAEGNYYLELSLKKSNIFKFIKSVFNSSIYKNLNLKEIHYKADDVNTIDRSTNNKILHSSYDVSFIIDEDPMAIVNYDIKKNIKIEILGDKTLIPGLKYIPANKLSMATDVQVLAKDKNSRAIFSPLNINDFTITLDNTKFTVNGNIKNDNKNKSIFNVNVSFEELDELFQNLIKQEILSIEQYGILTTMLKEISGENFPEDLLKFQIKNDEYGIKIGNTYFVSLLNHMRHFKTSK